MSKSFQKTAANAAFIWLSYVRPDIYYRLLLHNAITCPGSGVRHECNFEVDRNGHSLCGKGETQQSYRISDGFLIVRRRCELGPTATLRRLTPALAPMGRGRSCGRFVADGSRVPGDVGPRKKIIWRMPRVFTGKCDRKTRSSCTSAMLEPLVLAACVTHTCERATNRERHGSEEDPRGVVAGTLMDFFQTHAGDPVYTLQCHDRRHQA